MNGFAVAGAVEAFEDLVGAASEDVALGLWGVVGAEITVNR